MFPFKVRYSKTLNEQINPEQYSDFLNVSKEILSNAGADDFSTETNRVTFTNNLFKLFSGWNLMSSIDAGFVEVKLDRNNNTKITYGVTLIRTWIIGFISSINVWNADDWIFRASIYGALLVLFHIILLLSHLAFFHKMIAQMTAKSKTYNTQYPPFLILLSIALGVGVVLFNILRMKIDALGFAIQIFICIVVSILTFLIMFGLSYIVNIIEKKKESNVPVIHIFIHAIGIFILYYASWRICVYETPLLDKDQIVAKQIDELESIKRKTNRILNNGDIYSPSKEILVSDQRKIESSLKNLAGEITPDFKGNGEYGKMFYTFFDGLYLPAMDSIESLRERNIIAKSLTVKLILYSPDNKFMLTVLTFDMRDDTTKSRALVLIGTKEKSKIELFRYACVPNHYGFISQEYAYCNAILLLVNDDSPCYKTSPFKKKFWDSDYFKKVDVDGKDKYLFAVTEEYGYGKSKKGYNNTPKLSINIPL